MITFLTYLINGLNIGSVYAVIALGYTMVYGVAKMLNFAHGDVIMVGAFLAYCICAYLGLHPIIAVLGAVIGCTILGILIERLAYKPLRQATSLAVLITAIGMSYFLQNMAQLIWGSDTKSFPSIIQGDAIVLFKTVQDGVTKTLTLSPINILTMASCFIIMIALTLFINKTKMGKAMRCVSEDKGAAELMGINVNLTISVTFAIGSALAAVAGILLCASNYAPLSPTTGALPGIKAFTAAVFGGIGSIPGAMLGGILLGLIENLGKAYVSSELADAFVFGILIVVLLVKPTGLLGKKIHEKV